MRVGHGYDVHRFERGRDLIIGGVKIDYIKGLAGHSDADVLVHAVMDSLLGAAALGDIGHYFPDNDSSYYGADSLKLLSEVNKIIKSKGYYICNIDSTVVAQLPKLSPYVYDMRRNISSVCEIDIGAVNVKATTEEHMGFTGRMEGISSHAVCIINEF